MGALELRLLGGFQLRRDGEVLPPMPSRAARSLMAYLVLHRDRAHTRALLIGTFWPDMAESRGRRRLSHALWQIRTAVGDEDCLVTPGDSVRFDPDTDFWLDVDEFEWTLEQASPGSPDAGRAEADLLARAVDLYRGHLLAGFYDDWLFPDQDRLRLRYLGALGRLTDLAMARGDYDHALTHAQQMAQTDPLSEEAHRKIMRIAVLLGRHSDAIRQYERCRAVLEAELEREPSPETTALHEEILADRETGTARASAVHHAPLFDRDEPTPLVGRDRERATMASLLDAVLDGAGAVALIEGESGVGKTRLLDEAVADARWRGMTVLWGGSSPSGGLPFGPIAEALGTGLSTLHGRRLAGQLDPVWQDQLAPLIPGLGTGAEPVSLGPAEDRERMLEAIAVGFESLARLNPTFVVLEDLHWSDEETNDAVRHLAGRVAGHPILLALSYRHGEARERPEVWDLLRAVDRHPHSERISLAPCSPAQTEELIRRSLNVPEVSAEFSEQVHRETGGIPLFVVETLRARAERDDLDPTGGGDEPSPGLPITPTVQRIIQARLEGLPRETHDTLDLVSVHEGRLLLPEIVAASEADDLTVLEAVDDLVRRRLLVEQGSRFGIGHELMRRVVYDGLPLSRRLDLHRRVALAVERHRPEDVEVLAHHFGIACMPDRAADNLEKAAANALRLHAYDTAARHLAAAAAALEEIDADGERRYSVAALREEILNTLARRDEQEAALAEMERSAPDSCRSEVHRRRAVWLAHLDRFAEAGVEAQRAVEAAAGEDDGGRMVAALSAHGMISCYAGRAAEGVELLEEAARYRGADRKQQADARNALGHNLLDLQRFDEAESQFLAALALYGETGDARGQADVLGMLATLRMERGEPDLAAEDYLRAIDIAHTIGWKSGEAVFHMNLGILEAIRSRVGAARDWFEGAAAIYATMENSRGRAMVLANAAWLEHGYLGNADSAEVEATEALELYRELGDLRGEAQCLGTLGSIAGYRQDLAGARNLFRESIQREEDLEDAWLMVQTLIHWGATELDIGDPTEATSVFTRALQLCDTVGMDDMRISVLAGYGRALLACGRLDEADAATAEAAAALRPGIDQAYLVSYARSAVLRRLGDDDGADRHLRHAHDLLAAMLDGLDPDDRERAMARVPAHARIAADWERRQPQVVAMPVAAIDAPGGRALRPDDRVEVHWTVSEPADERIAGRIERRRHRIVRLLAEAAAQGAAPTVDDLAAALRSSTATIRRDLAALRAAGEEAATRGTRASTTD
ncbi:MAG: AAA family ATPase [Actinobacteria bacterium]|nr:AAA family ATPase [Actinomycetota bacterium]